MMNININQSEDSRSNFEFTSEVESRIEGRGLLADSEIHDHKLTDANSAPSVSKN